MHRLNSAQQSFKATQVARGICVGGSRESRDDQA